VADGAAGPLPGQVRGAQEEPGVGGVADIVFQRHGVGLLPRWRVLAQPQGHPVNKWYFERSKGTWKLDGSNWAMFLDDAVPRHQRDQVRGLPGCLPECRPSWADKKNVVD